MKTRIIHTKIWKDPWFINLPRASSRLFFYLITCESNNICGVFELSDRQILFDTGLNSGELEQAKKDIQKKAIFYKGWVKLPNSSKYNNYVTNTKLEKAYKKELALVPDVVSKFMKGYDTSMDTSIYTINNHKSKIINHKSKIKSIGEKDFVKIADSYKVPLSFVRSKYEDMVNWHKSTGKVKKDWLATLRSWVKKDSIKLKQEGIYGKKTRAIDATRFI